MKKVFLFACVAMMAAMVVSCGKKKLEGETIETKYFSVIMPEGWKKGGSSKPEMGCMISKGDDFKTQIAMHFNTQEYNPNMKIHDPAEMKQWNVERRGAVDKGEMEFNGHKYYAFYEEKYEKLTLLSQLADQAVLRIEIKRADLENEEIKTILDNVTIKEAASMPAASEAKAEDNADANPAAPAEKPEARQFECKYYTCMLPAGREVDLEDEYGIKLNVFELNDDGTKKGAHQRVELTHPKETVAELMKKWGDPKYYPKGFEKYNGGKYTIDGREMTAIEMVGQVHLLMDTPADGGCIQFKVSKFSFEKAPLVQDLLKSIKFK